MTWPAVARRDGRELAADNTLLVFVALFVVLGAGIAYGSTGVERPGPLSDALALVAMFAVPLTAGTVTHEAVPRNVASGRVRLTLSLPHSRRAFLAGVGAARLALVTAVFCLAVAAGAAVYLLRGGPLNALRLGWLVAATVLLGAAFVAVTLAVTARSRSTALAAAASYGFFLLAFTWPAAVALGRVLLAGQFGVAVPESTADAVAQLSPVFAFRDAMAAVGATGGVAPGPLPAWACLLVLAAWAAVGFGIAEVRFSRVDL